MDTPNFERARRFLYAEGRLLERRVFQALFEGVDADGALEALAGYRNVDGGFGHGLEPDKRAPSSQPLDVEVAIATMEAVGRIDEGVVRRACDFLASLGPGVGCLTKEALNFPRAAHWGEWALPPGLNPTAGLVAFLWRHDIDHEWRGAATSFCFAQLERGLPADAHGFSETLNFLDSVPDRARADAIAEPLAAALPGLALLRLDPASDEYGVTPLQLAPNPESRWSSLFNDDVIEGHLVALETAQCEDGGWPLSWETIGTAAGQECRGVVTLAALRTLRAYGRLA